MVEYPENPEPPTTGALDAVLTELRNNHPGQWYIEHDWTIEVRSTNGIIAKCTDIEDAESLIRWRKEYEDYLHNLTVAFEEDGILTYHEEDEAVS